MLRVLVAVIVLLISAWESTALDQPVSARKLIMRRTASGQEKVSFLTKDEAIPFPAFGSADDPASGTPGGVTIELFTQNQGMATLVVPAAVGWLTRDSSPPFFKFVNKLAPGGVSVVSSLLLKSGHAIRLRSAATGLPLSGALGAVGIRITIGSLRTCALFDASTIERDEGRTFLARDAVPDGLADCSNASLGGPTCSETFDAPTCGGTCPPGSACGSRDLSTCECIDANQPCGGTAPACNGECPAGEVCGNTGGVPYPGCGCLPAGSVASCGTTYPTCGGECPVGLDCFGVTFGFGGLTLNGCECLSGPPTDACGGCPAGFQCIVGPGFPAACLAFCTGPSGAPVCDGTCPASYTCTSIGGTCICQ